MTPKTIARARGILFMMDTNERLVLRNYLTCFESRKKGHKPKTLMLLDLLERYKEDDKVIFLFRKKVLTEDARRMVLARLLEKMLFSLTLDVNIAKHEIYDELAQARAKVAQGKVAAQVLIARGQRQNGIRALTHSIEIAKKFELFHDLVEMMLIYYRYPKTERGHEDSVELLNEINHASISRDAEFKARITFDEVVRQYGFKGLSRARPEVERLKFINERVAELQTAYEQTQATTIGYFHLLLLIESHQLQGQLEEATVHLKSLIRLVEDSPAIRNRVRMATAYGNLAANELWDYRYIEAEINFSRALVFLRENSRNHALISEYLFYCQFYSGQLLKAKTTLASLIVNMNIEQSEHRKAVRSYLMACIEFCLGNFSEVGRFLRAGHAISLDKEGWNVGMRILAIMNAIEQEDSDYADSLIVNLRQFVREGLRGQELRSREIHIIELLVELRKFGYDFKKTKAAKAKKLAALYNSKGDDAWQIQTPEIICFHLWFEAKISKKPYSVDYSEKNVHHY
jgi:hypothetical protein